jgi:hypothetical protein
MKSFILIFSLLFSVSVYADCIDLGANKAAPASTESASNYIIFYEGVLETDNECQLADSFQQDKLKNGIKYYTDRDYTLTSVPTKYTELSMVRLPNNDRSKTDVSGYVKLSFNSPTTIYVGYDSRITTLPAWMNRFKKTDDKILTSLSSQSQLDIYKAELAYGTITLVQGLLVKTRVAETTTNEDGTPITDLAYTKIYFKKIDADYIVTLTEQATSPTGGGLIEQYIIVPVVSDERKVILETWAEHYDISGNRSNESVKSTINVDIDDGRSLLIVE